jgi:hypothetical protein
MREERKVRKEKYEKKIKKHVSFYAERSEIKNDFFYGMPIILLVYKDIYFNINELDYCIP